MMIGSHGRRYSNASSSDLPHNAGEGRHSPVTTGPDAPANAAFSPFRIAPGSAAAPNLTTIAALASARPCDGAADAAMSAMNPATRSPNSPTAMTVARPSGNSPLGVSGDGVIGSSLREWLGPRIQLRLRQHPIAHPGGRRIQPRMSQETSKRAGGHRLQAGDDGAKRRQALITEFGGGAVHCDRPHPGGGKGIHQPAQAIAGIGRQRLSILRGAILPALHQK